MAAGPTLATHASRTALLFLALLLFQGPVGTLVSGDVPATNMLVLDVHTGRQVDR